jgi:poly(beta-D-mannuronate) lyase
MFYANGIHPLAVKYSHSVFFTGVLFATGFPGLFAAEHRVSTAAEIASAMLQAVPGDVLVMADGEWKDQAIVFTGKGTEEKPVTLRAQTPGKVRLTGNSSIAIDGEHLVVSGLFLQNGQGRGDGVKLAGRHCRLTECAVVGGSYKFSVHLFGTSNRMDHCYLAEKTNDDPTLQVEVGAAPNHHRLDHNHFGHRPPLGRNGGETIRVGYSHQSMSVSGTVVENNLFDRCDGELEIISSKSCENIYRANTFLECAGTLTLRHGNRCRVEANFFLGQHKRGSGGIRVIGDDHHVINNYIDGVENGGIWITSGIPDSELKGYFQARRCVIAFNTVVDSRGPCLELDAGFGTSRRSLRPEKITVANNLFSPGEDGRLFKGTEGEGWIWQGNVTAGVAADHTGVRSVGAVLARVADDLWRPTEAGGVRGVSTEVLAAVKTDIDGQLRTDPPDAGCDQQSSLPVTNRPLTAKGVGPSWLDWR